VGDTLDNYSTANYDTSATATLDVHGNQYGLLTSSKCFQQSQMDCSSCHDPHANENGKMETYSQRCLSCHGAGAPHVCTSPAVKQTNCIDCHMPALASQKIIMRISGKDQLVHDLVRTHRVAIYPDK
jgi:predicted CXXCH cytochrome family protein